MSDGDWGERRSSWLVRAAAGILVILAASGGIYGCTKQIGYEQSAENSAQEHTRYAHEKAEQTCLILPGGQQARCLADAKRKQEDQAREKRREYDDLVAQQTSALWTNIMGLAAITGMILSVIGVWLVYATFRETRRTANEAQRSADAFIASERGWLEISADSSRGSDDGATITLGIRGRVFGKAGIKVIAIHCRKLDSDSFPRHGSWEERVPRFSSLEPEQPRSWMSLATFEVPNVEKFLT